MSLYSKLKAYEDFHKSVINYNNWFIKLRYLAVVSLLLMFSLVTLFSDLKFTSAQIIAVTSTSVFILLYNIVLDMGRRKYRIDGSSVYQKIIGVSPLRVSLLQIVLDLIALSVIVYFTGGIETPIFLFYIFHMIIGALILPAAVIYSIAAFLIILFSVLSMLEYYKIIPHQSIEGLYSFSLYNELNFVVALLLFFSFTLIISILLTEKIVGELIGRERSLRNALKKLESAEVSKQKYIMGVVHELKNPIAATISFLELLKGGYVGTISDEADNLVVKAVKRLKESIGNINDILRVSRFKLLNKTEAEKIDLTRLIERIIYEAESIVRKKQLKVEFNNDSVGHYVFIGDTVLIHLALSNVISNSLKYTEVNGRILIEPEKTDKYISVEVSDSGIGIPQNEIDSVFEDYYRASNVGDREGTGTGMQTVRDVVEAHKGEMELSSPSKIGQLDNPGTTVKLKFPLNLPQQSD